MDPTLILLVVVLGAFIVFQIFQGRKRRRETENRQTLFVPGVEIMTNYGLYGTIISIDDDRNLAIIETTPGVHLKIHRQTILKVADYETAPVEDEVAVEDESVIEDRENGQQLDGIRPEADSTIRLDDERPARDAGEPRYGERIDDAGTARSADKKSDD